MMLKLSHCGCFAIFVRGVVLMKSGEQGDMLWTTNFEKCKSIVQSEYRASL